MGSYDHDMNHGSYPYGFESINKWVHTSGSYPHYFNQSTAIMKRMQGALLSEKVSKLLQNFIILGKFV